MAENAERWKKRMEEAKERETETGVKNLLTMRGKKSNNQKKLLQERGWGKPVTPTQQRQMDLDRVEHRSRSVSPRKRRSAGIEPDLKKEKSRTKRAALH